MHGRDPIEPDRPVLPWRLVVGVLLHVALPAYLIAVALAWLVAGPAPRDGDALLRFAGGVSWRFCAGYAALTLAAALAARALDPPLRRVRGRREAADPATAARLCARRVERATSRGARIGGVQLTAAVARVRDARWDHCDERCQAIAADLARAMDAFAAAHASAAPDRRERVAARAADALGRVAAAVEELAAERARLDEGDALTHAAYLAHRYGPALDPAGPHSD